jgi:hypothetical protein
VPQRRTSVGSSLPSSPSPTGAGARAHPDAGEETPPPPPFSPHRRRRAAATASSRLGAMAEFQLVKELDAGSKVAQQGCTTQQRCTAQLSLGWSSCGGRWAKNRPTKLKIIFLCVFVELFTEIPPNFDKS